MRINDKAKENRTMTSVKCLILTRHNKYFGQHLSRWKTIDIDEVENIIRKHGFQVSRMTFQEALSNIDQVVGYHVFYTSSQNREQREFIVSLISLLNKKNVVVPNLDLLLSHEKKGYQELIKQFLSIKTLKSFYFSNMQEYLNTKKKIVFPMVFKLDEGAGSKNVHLVHSERELGKIVRHYSSPKYLKMFVSFILYRIMNNKINYERWLHYQHQRPFVLQEYVKGLSHDFKVLIYWDKYFVLKRYTRKNDFRASGSGDFVYEDVPDELLEFASNTFKLLDTPFISFDLCFDGKNYKLIEFQANHFGPYTLIHSEGYYTKNSSGWKFVQEVTNLEREISKSLIQFINSKA